MIIWANLDCEATWAGLTLPKHVLGRISAASVLLAAFAAEGEPVEIYAPAPVDPARIHIGNVTMRVGAPAQYDLAWADPAAKAPNDRRFALAIAERLGIALSGARAIRALDELDTHLAGFGDRPWVCKAPWTAAGRDRVHGRGALSGELRVYTERLLERFGALLFEPWCDRLLDLGWCAGFRPHTLLTDERGGFLGIALATPSLNEAEHGVLERVAATLGPDLQRIGYVGPYAFDAFVYRDGSRKLHALCELNARHTFGHVAHAVRARFGKTRLGLGEAPANATVLVSATAGDPFTAWIA